MRTLHEFTRLLPVQIGGALIVGALSLGPVAALLAVAGLTIALLGVARLRVEDRDG